MFSPNLSYWEQTSFIGRPDLLIIGSGIVGLNAAISYREKYPNANILIIERSPIAAGGSTRNAGFACFGSISELLADLENHDEATVIQLVQKRWKGLQRLRKIVGDKNMDYQPAGNYEIFREGDQALYEQCQQALPHINKLMEVALGKKKVFQKTDSLIPNLGLAQTKHLIWNQAEGMINTGKMMYQLLEIARKQNIKILNGVGVQNLNSQPNYIHLTFTNNWQIKAEKVIVATNGFAQQLLSQLAVRPARNLVLVTAPIENLKVKGCFHLDGGYYYFRNIDNRILLGGGRNLDFETETTTDFGENPKIKTALLEILQTIILPQQSFTIDQWWSGILGVGNQKQPIIQSLNDRLVVAVRMGGMGVAIGSLVGEEAAEQFV